MEITARMSSKGQLTVPKAVRDALGLVEGDNVLAHTPEFLVRVGTIKVPARLGEVGVLRRLRWHLVSHTTARSISRAGQLIANTSVTGAEAVQMGLANHVTSGDDFSAEWRTWVDRFAAGSTSTITLMKENVRQALVEPLAAVPPTIEKPFERGWRSGTPRSFDSDLTCRRRCLELP